MEIDGTGKKNGCLCNSALLLERCKKDFSVHILALLGEVEVSSLCPQVIVVEHLSF